MTIKEKFLIRSDVYSLPVVVISNNPVKMWHYKSLLYMMNDKSAFDICNLKYKASSIQTDIDGNDSFMIIFTED